MLAPADATLPESFFCRSMRLNCPMPLSPTICDANAGRHVVRVRRQRRPARARRVEQHFVRLEVRRLHEHAHAVRQRPLGDVDRRNRLRAHDLAGRRHVGEQRVGRQVLRVRRRPASSPRDRTRPAARRASGSSHRPSPATRAMITRFSSVIQLLAELVDVAERDRRHELLRDLVLVLDSRNRFAVQIVVDRTRRTSADDGVLSRSA